MTTLELTIDDIGAQGDGIAHYKNATLFVTGALGGERVQVELESSKNIVKRAKLVKIVKPSPQRAEPSCPHFPQCGGCRFQHMKDEAYTQHKLTQLQQTFFQAKLKTPPFLPPVVTAAQTRRRARIAVKHDKGGVTLGFNEWRSHEIVDLKACAVLKPQLVELIQKLRLVLPHWLPRGKECDIQMTALDEGLDVVMIGGPALDLHARQNLGILAEKLGITHLSWRKWDRSPIEPIAHRAPLTVTFGGTRLPFPPGSFLQATQSGETALIDFVKNVSMGGAKVLDLFCGLGTFGLSLQGVKSVHFADLDGPAVEALEKVGKQNPRFEIGLRNLIGDPFSAGECSDYDLIIFDPPRGGAKAQAVQIAKSKAPSVVAISCDPASFARDAQILIEGGYKLKTILPVDQFLWSPHLELAAHFVR